jgi:hypothetical protein
MSSETTGNATTPAQNEMRPIIEGIIAEARLARQATFRENRCEERQPFFRSVILEVGGRQYSAFTRDVSDNGMGFLHNAPIAGGEIVVRLNADSPRATRIRMKLMWCMPCGEGWYISGGRFIGMA